MKLTTTLNKIRRFSPYLLGWKTLLTYLGKTEADDDEINLLTILDSNGVEDMLWCLRATIEDSRKVSSQLALEFAEEVLPIFEARYSNDQRPRLCLQTCKDYQVGSITIEQLREARRGASAAAYAATAYADEAAAASAAYAADATAASAAYAADATAAATTATARQKARDRQAEVIRSILEN